jgi:hypothetical protein
MSQEDPFVRLGTPFEDGPTITTANEQPHTMVDTMFGVSSDPLGLLSLEDQFLNLPEMETTPLDSLAQPQLDANSPRTSVYNDPQSPTQIMGNTDLAESGTEDGLVGVDDAMSLDTGNQYVASRFSSFVSSLDYITQFNIDLEE